MHKNEVLGHLISFVTVMIWGSTFIFTKTLLQNFQPYEILIYRFLIGYIVLWIIYPRFLGKTNIKNEFLFMICGLFGVFLYYLIENTALIYTNASNIGVIISIAPFFTALILVLLKSNEILSKNFFLGFIIAIWGIFFISFKNFNNIEIKPIGDILAVAAAFIWGCYSVLIKKAGSYEYNMIAVTRRIFLYGIIFLLLFSSFMNVDFDITKLKNVENLFNLLFLGVFASALCFVFWNQAIKILGAAKTSIYIYMTPVISVFFASLFLGEKITLFVLSGTVLTILGLVISKNKAEKNDCP